MKVTQNTPAPAVGDIVRIRPGRTWGGQPLPTDVDYVVKLVDDQRHVHPDAFAVVVDHAAVVAYLTADGYPVNPDFGPTLGLEDLVLQG